jgi:hypothetical protein
MLFLVSCQKDYNAGNFSEQTAVVKAQTGVVPLDVATGIAKNFFKMYYGNVENKEIDNQLTIDENGVPNFYLYNYKGGGFLIVSAEYGEMPILANDMGSVFPAKGEQINAGLGMWLLETNERIKAIRAGKIKPSKGAEDLWNQLKNNDFKSPFKIVTPNDIRRNGNNALPRWEEDGSSDQCGTFAWTNTQVSRLMRTTWGQGCGYNYFTPPLAGPCNHAYTGCVATAMAQVVKYHNFPTSGNYAALADEVYAFETNSPVAMLIYDCAQKVNMNYGSVASGTQTSNIESALEAQGYSSAATYANYSSHYTDHRNNIAIGNPVILDGCTDYSCFLWFWCWGSGDCHAWVSDGMQVSNHPCYGERISFRMNWGWRGAGDGFYYNPIPNPIEVGAYYNFQYDRDILYNIHP